MNTSATIINRRTQVLTLAAACLALFAIFLDNTIVNVAIPAIQRDLRSAPDQLEWTVNAYVVAFAGLVLLGGKFGDRLGRRRMFVTGLLLFGAASAAGALSNSSSLLIGARAVQGVGAALLAPLSLSLLAQVFRREELPAAIGVWAGVSGLGLAIGPLVGGLLVDHASWHAVFWVNVPIAVLSAVLTLVGVPESRDAEGGRIDIPGALLATAGLISIVTGLSHAVLHPWSDAWSLGPLTAGAILLAGFAVQQAFSRNPLVPVAWLRKPEVLVSVTTLALASFALFGAIFLISLYLQDVRGYSAVQAGVRMLPLTLTTLIVAPVAGKIVAKRGPFGILIGGLVLTGIATATLTQLGVNSGYGSLALRLSALGIGLALALPTVVSMVLGQVPVDRVGIASGLVTMSRQFGGSLGLAVLATVGGNVAADSFQHQTGISSLRGLVAGGQVDTVKHIAGSRAAAAASQAFVDGFTATMWLATATVAAAFLIAVAVFWTRRHSNPKSENVVQEGPEEILNLQVNDTARLAQQSSVAVAAQHLGRRFGRGDATVEALKDVSVDFRSGSFTAIMGASGSGKSTLLHILAGLDRPTSGSVAIAGIDITRLGDKQLTLLRREKIGFIFQFFNLLPTLTARENIVLPLNIAGTNVEEEPLDRLMRRVGLEERRVHRPSELSGGQQQRVAIARALMTKPAVVFADEPTGNLDSKASDEVLSLMRDAVDRFGQTVVMVTHDAHAASVEICCP